MITQLKIVFLLSSLVGAIVLIFLFNRWKSEASKVTGDYERLIKIVENTKDIIYYYQIKPERQFKYLSPSGERLYGKGAIELAYENPNACYAAIHPDDYNVLHKKIIGEVDYNKCIIQRWKNKDDGKFRWTEEYTTPIYENGELIAIQGVIRNVDEKMKLQQELQYRIHHDALTDIYNREYFELKFNEYNNKVDTSIAIIICDLDELKFINDHYGHKQGDELIRAFASLLHSFSSENIIVSRLGGDEFALLVVETESVEVEKLIDHIRNEIYRHNANNSQITIKASIGFSYTKNTKGNMSELFSLADRNMYLEKLNKKQMRNEKGPVFKEA